MFIGELVLFSSFKRWLCENCLHCWLPACFVGGDQGLLNMYFRDWATKDIARHLPFIYNVVSQAFYSYLPAFTQWVLILSGLLWYPPLPKKPACPQYTIYINMLLNVLFVKDKNRETDDFPSLKFQGHIQIFTNST